MFEARSPGKVLCKIWKTTIINLDYYTQQYYLLQLKEKQKLAIKKNVSESLTTKIALEKILKVTLSSEEKDKHT